MTPDPYPSSAFSAACASAWRPGRSAPAAYGELFVKGDECAGVAMALALARDQFCGETSSRSWLWVQDRASLRVTGRPYRLGLPEGLRAGLVHVVANRPEDALFALEEGLRCRDFTFVIGEMVGNPRSLDFTASRRLSLAVERHGVPLWLVRLNAERDLSAARMRWSVQSVPSPPPRWNHHAPGTPSWNAELFRARTHATGEWILRDDGNSLALEQQFPAEQAPAPPDGDLAGTVPDRSLATG